MRYSLSTGNFYPEDIEYPDLPEDITSVSDEDFHAAMARHPGDTIHFLDGRIVITPADPKTPQEANAEFNAGIVAEILAIESRQHRAIREAALNIPGASVRLQVIEDQIANLREQLH